MDYYLGNRPALLTGIRERLEVAPRAVGVKYAVILMKLGDAAGTGAFMATLADRDLEVRTAAAGYLGEIYPINPAQRSRPDVDVEFKDFVPLVAPLLNEPNTPAGRAATSFFVANFCESVSASTIAAIEKLCGSDDPEDAEVILWHCSNYAHRDWLRPYTRRLLRHANGRIRATATTRLLEMDDREGVLAAKVLLSPTDPRSAPGASADQLVYALLTCGKNADAETAALVARTAREILDAVVGALPGGGKLADRLGGNGYRYLLGAALRRPGDDVHEWLASLASNPALDAHSRALAAIESIYRKALRKQEQTELSVALKGLMPCFNVIAGTLIAGLREAPDTFLDSVLAILAAPNYRSEIVYVLRNLPYGPHSPRIAEALDTALAAVTNRCDRHSLVDALAGHRDVDDEMLATLDPWRALEVYWRREGITLAQAAELLEGAGAIRQRDRAELASTRLESGHDVVDKLFFAKDGECGLYAKINDEGLEFGRNDHLFKELVALACLGDDIDAVSQREDETRGVATVRFVQGDAVYRFDARLLDSRIDVDTVAAEVNFLLVAKGSKRRVFGFGLGEMAESNDYGEFCVADEDLMRKAAIYLRLPIIEYPQLPREQPDESAHVSPRDPNGPDKAATKKPFWKFW